MAEDISCYMNCSKYFSLKPVSGNLKSFCVPSIVVYVKLTASLLLRTANRFTLSAEFENSITLGMISVISPCISSNGQDIETSFFPRRWNVIFTGCCWSMSNAKK